MHLRLSKPKIVKNRDAGQKAKVNAGRKAKANNAGQRAQTLRKFAKTPTRVSNASHTRSHGRFPDPPVRLEHPRLRIEGPRFGIHDGRFHCDAIEEVRRKGRPLRLVAMSVKESTIPGAGRGLFVREDVPDNTIFAEYGGELITLAEARKRQMQVISCCVSFLQYQPYAFPYLQYQAYSFRSKIRRNRIFAGQPPHQATRFVCRRLEADPASPSPLVRRASPPRWICKHAGPLSVQFRIHHYGRSHLFGNQEAAPRRHGSFRILRAHRLGVKLAVTGAGADGLGCGSVRTRTLLFRWA